MHEGKRILLCEDEDSIRDFVMINLERVGYTVTGVDTGEKALECFLKNTSYYSVVLLDVMLPGIDGFSVCKEIRRSNSSVGIIMLSAKAQEMDKVNGLMLGADDYIAKPFSPSELIARIDALFRRMNVPATPSAKAQEMDKVNGLMLGADDYIAKPFSPSELIARIDALFRRMNVPATPLIISSTLDELVSGTFLLNTRTQTLTKNGVLVGLTQVEYQLMEKFLKAPNTTIDRKELLESIWGKDFYGDEKIVDVNIRRLRMKVEDNPSSPVHLTTVWGLGYKWLE